EAGLVKVERAGRRTSYYRAGDTDLSSLNDALHFYSEVAPCGVVGSFLLDKTESDFDAFTFKHHYITSAIDSGVMVALFTAMREKRAVTLTNLSRRKDQPRRQRVVPLRVMISVQSGRQHLMAYLPEYNTFQSYRLDYLSRITLEEPTPRFDELRAKLDGMQGNMWGVRALRNAWGTETLEHVSFTVVIEDGEEHIVKRLEREKRIGTVEKLDDHTYRFSADVYDTGEMIPWIRTFICRIKKMTFSNRTLENRFKRDLEAMYRLYGIGEEDV
ncbi:MAG: WYL domain-containing protein, partial [Clostridia bacterium]|nr:WYL domain-containing protein [Clostridia bacterium]